MEVNSPKQLGLGGMRRALNKLWGLFSVVSIVMRCSLLFRKVWRCLDIFCATLAWALGG